MSSKKLLTPSNQLVWRGLWVLPPSPSVARKRSSSSFCSLLRFTGVSTTTRQYNANSELTQLTDPVGNDTIWTRDNLGRVTAETNELGQSRTMEYDAASNLKKRTDRNGRVIEFTLDNL